MTLVFLALGALRQEWIARRARKSSARIPVSLEKQHRRNRRDHAAQQPLELFGRRLSFLFAVFGVLVNALPMPKFLTFASLATACGIWAEQVVEQTPTSSKGVTSRILASASAVFVTKNLVQSPSASAPNPF